MALEIEILPLRADNYAYLLVSEGEAAVVDPGDAGPVLRRLAQLDVALTAVLLTHHHLDHVAGWEQVRRRGGDGCRVVGPRDSRLPMVDTPMGDGDRLRLGSETLCALAVPGHTRSHIAFHAGACAAVWTGDTLFAGGCGRVLEGTAAEMWASLQRLRALPDDTRIYCGHEYTADNLEFAASLLPHDPAVARRLEEVKALVSAGQPAVPSLLAEEKRSNPFLRADSEALAMAAGLPGADGARVFEAIRRRKDAW